MIDLRSYTAIQSNLFVRLAIDYYKATPDATPTQEVLRFSDYDFDFDINGETYTPLGKLMSVGETSSELRVSSYELVFTISGIPNSAIFEIVNSRIKGSAVEIYRTLLDPETTNLITGITNPQLRFKGIVNNFTLNEQYDVTARTSENTLVFTCTSDVSVLENKISGRRTNPESMKAFFPQDKGFDRVPNLKNTRYDFGKET